jgi:mRNA interferase MazF
MGHSGLIWRGEVYDIDLGQPIGHEPAFVRPAVIVSVDILNNGSGELVVIVPIGSTRYGLRSHVELGPGASELDHVSYARCDQIRTISTKRLLHKKGAVSQDEMSNIDQTLRFVLDL